MGVASTPGICHDDYRLALVQSTRARWHQGTVSLGARPAGRCWSNAISSVASETCCAMRSTRSTRFVVPPSASTTFPYVSGLTVCGPKSSRPKAIQRRFPLPQSRDRSAVADDVDDRGIEAVVDRDGLGEGPRVLHVVGARRHQDREVQQRPRDVGLQRRAAGAVAADLARPCAVGGERAAVEAGGRTRQLRGGGEQRQAAAGAGVDVVRRG